MQKFFHAILLRKPFLKILSDTFIPDKNLPPTEYRRENEANYNMEDIMNKLKRYLHKLLYPHAAVIVLLTLFSAAGLFCVFISRRAGGPAAYAVYLLTFYTICVLAAAFIRLRKWIGKKLHANTHSARYLSEAELRTRISLYTGTVINLAYAVFKLVTGILYDSVWFGAVAIYYFALCIIRFTLIRYDRKIHNTAAGHDLYQWKSCKSCGLMLLWLNLIISAIVSMTVYQNKSYFYPGYVIYASAMYTLYRLTVAIVKLLRFRKDHNPLLAAATALDFTIALMAVFSLQTAILAALGAVMSEGLRRTMNTVTGGGVCLFSICIAVFMILRAVINLRRQASYSSGSR